MKTKKLKLLKLALLLGMMLTLPALHAAPSFKLMANPIETTDGGGVDDKGGGSTKDGGSGGGGSGGVIKTIYDAVKSIFSGVGGGTSGTSC